MSKGTETRTKSSKMIWGVRSVKYPTPFNIKVTPHATFQVHMCKGKKTRAKSSEMVKMKKQNKTKK